VGGFRLAGVPDSVAFWGSDPGSKSGTEAHARLRTKLTRHAIHSLLGQGRFRWIPPEDVSMRTPNTRYFPIQRVSLSSIGDSGRTRCFSWLNARQPKALSVQVSEALTRAAYDKKVIGGQVSQRIQKGQATYAERRDRLMEEESSAKRSALSIELNQATALAFTTDNPELAPMTKAKAKGATKP
jgi:hypothetical protein